MNQIKHIMEIDDVCEKKDRKVICKFINKVNYFDNFDTLRLFYLTKIH